jgi:branched-chain amino acid transport system substrate-binding protein
VSHLDRRQLLRIFGAVATASATGAVAGCTSESDATRSERPSGRTIGIGLIAPAIGPYRAIGADITNGFKLYLEDHGGLLGRHRVDLKVEEEGSSARSARAAADALLARDGVIALAGVASPVSLTAISDAVEKAKVPLVCPSGSPTTLTSTTFMWRTSYVEGEAGMALAPYAVSKGSRAYLLYDDSPTAGVEAGAFGARFEDLGGTIVNDVRSTTSFDARMRDVGSANPHVLFCSYAGASAQELIGEYRKSGITTTLVGPGSLTETADLGKVVQRGVQPPKIYTAMPYAYDLDNGANRRFVSSYHKKYGVAPSTYAMAAFDAAGVIDRALRLIDDEPTGVRLNQAFSLVGQIESPRGSWTFNRNRTPQQKWYLRRVRLNGPIPGNLLDADLEVLT